MAKQPKPDASTVPTPDAAYVVTSAAEVASFARVSARTVATWLARGMPGGSGRYDLRDVFEWVRVHVPVPHSVAKAAGRPQLAVDPPTGPTKDDLEKDKLRIGNERLALRLARERGELINRAAAVAEVEQLFCAIAARLDSVPDEVGSSLPPDLRADIVADWKNKMNGVRRELAGFKIEEGSDQRPQKAKAKKRKQKSRKS
ncbi:MAG TPA: hypothetical protein VGM05_13095 [Planctomycetaceae bacterium]|jgi:phage terminase Nu1 subunit (DNA packaging protein)